MQYTEKELAALIKNVESEFTAHLFKSEAGAAQPSLAKAEDEKPEKKESKESDSGDKQESKPEAKSKEESGEAPAKEAPAAEAKPEGEAPAAPSEEMPTGEAPVAPSADEGASGYDAEDIAHMDAMYMSMSKAELLAHHDSCVRALDAIGAEHTHAAAAAPAAPAAEAAPAAPAAPAAEIDKCGDMSMQKTETSVEVKPEVIVQETKETEILKSEFAAAKAKNEELQKSLDAVSSFLTAFVKKVPQGKAITQYEQVQKSESVPAEDAQLSKSEISSILSKKAADPTLSKNDREAINAFYLNNANVNTISHLLK